MKIFSDIYNQILKCMPISCVDLLAVDKTGNILLINRKNKPVKGQWWFPGRRMSYKETRREAAIRKLTEECNLGKYCDQYNNSWNYNIILHERGS